MRLCTSHASLTGVRQWLQLYVTRNSAQWLVIRHQPKGVLCLSKSTAFTAVRHFQEARPSMCRQN